MAIIRNCKVCGRIFSYAGGMAVCEPCRNEDDDTFKKVKDYLYDNPGASLSEVSSAVGTSIQRIKGYLKDGRLEIMEAGGNLILECEKCGKSIKTGKYCDNCMNSLASNLKMTAKEINDNIISAESKNRVVEMRYLKKGGW